MHKLFFILFTFISFTSSAFAEDRLYVGPIAQGLNSIWSNNTKQSGAMYGAILGLDHTQKNSLYWGAEVALTQGKLRGSAGNDLTTEYWTEWRLGYEPCFTPFPELSIVPYVGIGYTAFNQNLKNSPNFKSHFWYVPFGVRANYALADYLKVGFRGSVAPMFGGEWKIYRKKTARTWLLWKAEVPLTYTTSYNCIPFDISVVPYIREWAYRTKGALIGQKNIYWGGKLEFGYHF